MAFRTNKTPVLQTKSASGSVATFNTALAMPLASCNIAVNAWQEGSGDPSPSNVRPIHGFSEVNIYQRGINLFDISAVEQGKWLNLQTGAIQYTSNDYYLTDYIPVKAGVVYTMRSSGSSRRWTYDVNKQPVSVISSDTFTPSVDGFVLITIGETRINDFYMTIGSTIQPEEPYTGNIYTIQLGQEVYGAEVDVVNGVATVTHEIVTYDGSENGWTWFEEFQQASIQLPHNAVYDYLSVTDYISDYFKSVSNAYRNNNVGNYCSLVGSGSQVAFSSPETSLNNFKSWLSTHNTTFVYKLTEPFDIQLTPTQIETLIGNNTIFADIGDIDLTYKDLDLAKRGNFREVFRLPS